MDFWKTKRIPIEAYDHSLEREFREENYNIDSFQFGLDMTVQNSRKQFTGTVG